jgi:hypothetical protein
VIRNNGVHSITGSPVNNAADAGPKTGDRAHPARLQGAVKREAAKRGSLQPAACSTDRDYFSVRRRIALQFPFVEGNADRSAIVGQHGTHFSGAGQPFS